jgi:NAD(P)-dependent dehydrogenase (short-subunit alcohol dehydrogenase family)
MSLDNLAHYPSLVDKTIVITGGGSGIGGAMSVLFAEQRCSVVVLDIADEPSRQLVDGLCSAGKRAAYFRCDLTDVAALQRTIHAVEAAHGDVHVLINNAARDDRQDLMTATVDYWDEAIAVNVRHHLFATQAVVPGMARTLARELGPMNIRVNSLVPGATLTERQRALWWTPEEDRQFVDLQALKFRLEASDVARVALFMASDEARGCTGANFVVDAGLTQN